MAVLDLVNLSSLVSLTQGSHAISVALLDGPVNTSLPDFASCQIEDLPSNASPAGMCNDLDSDACSHGTLTAGVLIGRRDSTPALCPGCTLLVRPIFGADTERVYGTPVSRPEILAAALLDAIRAGAHIVNLSCGLLHCSVRGEGALADALDLAEKRGILVVAAAGNQATVGGSFLTKHSWVIPVVAVGVAGRPSPDSNLGASIGRRGLAAPGENVPGLTVAGEPTSFSGTSAACPFVSGAAALLWSLFPELAGARIREALLSAPRRLRSIVPPIMNAWVSYQLLASQIPERRTA